jgi:hypothetical protein
LFALPPALFAVRTSRRAAAFLSAGFATQGAIAATAAFVIDVVLVGRTRAEMGADGFVWAEARFGAVIWMTLVAAIGLWIAAVIPFVARRWESRKV